MDRMRGRSRAVLMIVALLVTSVASPASAAAVSQARDASVPASTGTASSVDRRILGFHANVDPTQAKPLSLAGARYVGATRSKAAACDRPFRAKGLVDVLSPVNGATVGAMPLVVRLRLSKSADPESLKVTLNRTRSIEGLFADCGGEMEARLYAADLKPGKNVLKVVVGKRGHGGREVVTVRFKNDDHLLGDTPATPACKPPPMTAVDAHLCPIRTQVPIAGGSGVGISVGWGANAVIYDSTAVGGDQGYQVLLLDRATLAPVRNESLCMTYMLNECYPGTTGTDYDFMLKRLTDPDYYSGCGAAGCIVVIQSFHTAMPNSNMGWLFSRLGGTNSIQGTPSFGSAATEYSLITSVGKQGNQLAFRDPGEGEERISCFGDCVNPLVSRETFDPDLNGGVAGYLGLDSTGNYAYHRPGSELRFSTGDGSATNVITVGPQKFPLAQAQGYPSAYPGGFQVVVVNAVRPDLAQYPPQNLFFDQAGDFASFVQGLSEAQLVLVRSIGDPSSTISSPLNDPGIGPQIERLGGSIAVLYNLRDGDDYSLVGSPKPDPASGAQRAKAADASSLDARAAQPSGPIHPSNLSGWLTRNNRGFLEPTSSTTTTVTLTHGIEAIVYSDLTPWPVPSTPAEAKAYLDLSNGTLGTTGVTADLRSTYAADRSHDADRQNLDKLFYGQTAATQCGAAPPIDVPTVPSLGYTWHDYCAVWSQLDLELDYVIRVWTREALLEGLFSSVDTSGTGDLHQVFEDINQGFQNPPGPTPLEKFLAGTLEGVVGFATFFPEDTTIVRMIGLGDETIDLANTAQAASEDGDPQPDLSTTWAHIETDLAGRFKLIESTIRSQFAMIVTDWGKLQTLGTLLKSDPAWQWSPGTVDPTLLWQTSMEISMRVEFYRELLVAMFGNNHLVGVGKTTAPVPEDFYTCDQVLSCPGAYKVYPFQPFHGKLAADSWVVTPQPGNPIELWDLHILANVQLDPLQPTVNRVPTEDLLAPLFQPLDPLGTVNKSGVPYLGLYKPRFLAQDVDVTLTLQQAQCFAGGPCRKP